MVTKSKEGEVTALLPNYTNLSQVLATFQEVIQANAGDSFALTDLPTIRVPTGGNTTWTLPTLEGEQETKEIQGVIVAWRDSRTFWEKSLDEAEGGNQPPQCYSSDSFTGSLTVSEISRIAQGHGLEYRGEVSHSLASCYRCPFTLFGTAKGGKGRGQWCKSKRVLYVLLPDMIFPYSLIVPTMSIKPLRSYFTKLMMVNLPYYAVLTSFTLTTAKNSDGIKYSEIVPQQVTVLPPEQRDQMRTYHEAIAPYLAALTGQLVSQPGEPEPENGELAPF